ncbi:hypothetical protein D9M72_296220 [compost metagenome]
MRVGALVGTRHVDDALLRGPGRHLLVDRDDTAIVDRDRGGFLQHLGAFGVIHGRQRLFQHHVHLGVAVFTPVGGAKALLAVLARQQRAQRRADLAGLRAPPEQAERPLVLDALGRVGGHRHAFHLGGDADAGQVLRDGLRDLLVVDVAVVGRVQRHAEAVRVACLGQQLLGAFGIVLDRLQVGVVAEQRGWHQVVGRLRQAFHQPVLDALPVDRHADGVAHARIFQRVLVQRRAFLGGHVGRLVALGIEIQVDHAVRDLGEERQLGILPHLGQVGRRHVLDRLHVARQQRGQTRGRVGDEAQRGLVPGRLGAPVVVVAHQFDPVVAGVADELERPGADHALALGEVVRAQALRGLLLHDEDRRQVVQHQRVRLVGGQLDGVLVDHLLVDDRLGVDIELARAVLDGGRAVQRPDDVFGGQLGTVMELHALADLEFPGQVVDQLP